MSASPDFNISPTAPIRIIGVGNPLMGDDGVGPALVCHLARHELPPGVEVLDAGTGGLTLLGLLEGAAAAILVDAAELDRPPGTIMRMVGPDLQLCTTGTALSSHSSGLSAALALGRELDMLPQIVLYLIQVSRVVPGAGLSSPVSSILDRLACRIVTEAHSLASAIPGSTT